MTTNFGPLIPNPASVFVLHLRISRKVTSKFRKCAFSTLLGALPSLHTGSQNSQTQVIENPPFFASFAIISAICPISIVITETNYNGNMTYWGYLWPIFEDRCLAMYSMLQNNSGTPFIAMAGTQRGQKQMPDSESVAQNQLKPTTKPFVA